MNESAVFHIPENVFAYPVNSNTLKIRIKTAENDFKNINILFKNIYNHVSSPAKEKMKLIASCQKSDWFEASIFLEEKRFKYCFEMDDGENKAFYSADGFMKKPDEKNFFFYPYINESDIIAPPNWAEGVIIYQILVDRFYDGNPENNPPYVRPWNIKPDRNTYYGGDFEGITEKLEYLKELGVAIIYLSPVFLSESYHKYDVIDYERIEEIYGGEEKLKDLVKAAHSKGIKIILDAVFNHCSDKNAFFQDVLKNQNNSEYVNWFSIKKIPITDFYKDYDSFGGLIPSMPRFNTDNEEVIDYLVGIAEKWTEELDIDGWRLDVADEVSHVLWQTFKKRLMKKKKDILIIGEIWNNAGRWLNGYEMDTATNYKYMTWIRKFAAGEITAVEFWDHIESIYMLYKSPLHTYLVNLLGSHDTLRNMTYIGDEKIHEIMMLTTLCFQGMPLIYYGDEIAMEGEDDPDNRRALNWGKNEELRHRISKLANIRCKSDTLKKGSMIPLLFSDRIISFERVYENERLFCIANFDENSVSVSFDTKTVLLYGNAKCDGIGVVLPPKSFALLKENK